MDNNLKEIVEEIIKKAKDDPNFIDSFKEDPVKALEGMTGVDLPDQMVEPAIAAVKARLGAEDLGNVLGKLGGLLGK